MQGEQAPLLDRIEVRRSGGDRGDVRVVADIGRVTVTFQVSLAAGCTNRTAPRACVTAIVTRLENATMAPIPSQPPGKRAIGYEVSLTTGMTQSVFRWVAATPSGWESIAQAADELIALAGSIDVDVVLPKG